MQINQACIFLNFVCVTKVYGATIQVHYLWASNAQTHIIVTFTPNQNHTLHINESKCCKNTDQIQFYSFLL